MSKALSQRGALLRPSLWALGACLGLAACSARGCGSAPEDAGAADPSSQATLPPPALTLAIVTDLKGYLEPCGCTSRSLGGIDRVAARVAATRASGPTLTLLAGDIFFSGQEHGPHTSGAGDAGDASHSPADAANYAQRAHAGQDALNAETVADVLARFEVGAALPGAHDLAAADALATLAERARLPLLGVSETSARRVSVGEHAVLVVGVAEDEAGAAAASVEAVLARPDNAERDLVVALTRGGRRVARGVAQVAGVHVVVVGGADQDDALTPARVGDALVLHASRQGQGVTVAGVHLPTRAGDGAVVDVSPWTAAARADTLRGDIRELEASLVRWEREGAAPDALTRQRARLERMRAELAQVAPPSLPVASIAVHAEFFELPPDAAQDPDVTESMVALARRVNEHNRTTLADWAPVPAAEGQPHYVGSATCESCHTEAYAWWRRHPHGRAYSTLEVRHKQFNLSCVGCHVTGYLQPGGSTVTQVGADQALVNVGCENCHGPGSAHVASEGRVAPARRDVPEAVCVSCHNPEHSDRFVYEPFRRTLLVPGHGLPSAGGRP